MSSSVILDEEKFLQIVHYLSKVERSKNFHEICAELSMDETQMGPYMHLLHEVNWDPKSDLHGSAHLLEWGTQCENPLFESGQESLSLLESIFDNESIEQKLGQSFSKPAIDGQEEMLTFLEEAICEKFAVKVSTKDGKLASLYPRRVVYLDGSYALVAQGSHDSILSCLNIDEIASAVEEDISWAEGVSNLEIEDFISSLRLVSDTEVRLVLKVYSRERFNSNLKRHFFGKQCMFTNPQGDFIWAASIEPNEQIFAWLEDLGQDVEILDPLSIKKEFLKYCEAKLKKLA